MNLEQLEAQLQKLIEVKLINALPGQKPEDLIVQKLRSALESNTILQPDGSRLAPNVYTFLVNADSLDRWKEPHLLDTLIDVLTAAGQAADVRFNASPAISISEDPSMPLGDFDIIASHRLDMLEETKDMLAGTPGETEFEPVGDYPESAFLIVEGVKVFQLRDVVINIGRRLDNTLVIDDPRVSRNHAQLRAIRGRFVLFDLSSTGGTFVNGQPANQTVLYPGDVISLAGVSLIFGQDNPVPRPDLGDTAPRSKAGADRETAVIRTMPPLPKKNK